MPWDVDGSLGTDPQAAIDWFRSRLPLTEEEFKALAATARRRAFTVSGLSNLDMVQEAMNGLDNALAQGQTFEEFQAALSQRVRRAWGGQSPYRLGLVFDTNLQQAYGAGRYQAASALTKERPFWGLNVVLDGRTSRICLPLAGVVRPADDPFWQTHTPPLHFRCRSALTTYSEPQAQAQGITAIAPEVPPLEGFGNPPGANEWQPDPHSYDPELWKAYQRLQQTRMPDVEQERAKPGTHFDAVRSSVPASVRDTVLRGAQRAGLLGYLERNPIPEVRIVPALADAQGAIGGDYDPRTRVIRVSVERDQAALAASLGVRNWGGVQRVSDVAASVPLSMQKTFVHELSHDLLWRWADLLGNITDVEARVRPVFKGANPVSVRATADWKEYFCETYAAYVYHRAVLKRLDPGGYAIVEEARKALGIEVQP